MSVPSKSVATGPVPLIERVLGPFHRFASTSAAGGLVLLATTILAVTFANSPWADLYHHVWETPFSIGTPGFPLTLSIHHWVNDVLMAVFFFLVGLEIKREVLVGELATRRTATCLLRPHWAARWSPRRCMPCSMLAGPVPPAGASR